MPEPKYMRTFLIIVSCFVLYFVFRIFQPFLVPLSLAIILVTLCYPIYDWTSRSLRGSKNLASLLTCCWITLAVIVPLIILATLLAKQVAEVYQQAQRSLEAGQLQAPFLLEHIPYLAEALDWIGQLMPMEDLDFLGSLTGALRQISLFFLRQSTTILSGLFVVISDFVILLISMFFLFKDGSRLMDEIRSLTPLSRGYQDTIVEKLREVARATVLGALATAVAQGLAGGILFWLLGISNSLFWGFLMALGSLIPLFGTGLVWAPWAVYLLLTGSPLLAVLLAVGGLFVAMIDNVLRPLFIEGSTEMHTLVVFFSILGGISYMGIVGVIFGPLIVTLGLALIELFKLEFGQGLIHTIQE